jgi:hypothetical protein
MLTGSCANLAYQERNIAPPNTAAECASTLKMPLDPYPSDKMHIPAGFQTEYKLVPAEVLFTKHVRCLIRPELSSWETDTSKPLCSDKEVLHPEPKWGGVPVCPVSVVQDVRARYNV